MFTLCYFELQLKSFNSEEQEHKTPNIEKNALIKRQLLVFKVEVHLLR